MCTTDRTPNVQWFPILGGRLLKHGRYSSRLPAELVSNPWREAIEVQLWKKEFLF